ncbi:MAG: pyridoxal phosphate-dependent aminotransferase [Deltaproteobacteria bacterium]|nr:pyridoxal phosphate-dependent aminotransferase [Deltaproteobacteria bacterium]
MKYNFDKKIKRYNTGSVKWDLVNELFGGEDLLPMWIADMDFEIPEPVIKALRDRAMQGIFGYTACMPSYYEATIEWLKKRHTWQIEKEWIVFCPGVVPALNMLIQTFTIPGDKVILQLPVYYPFMSAVKNNGRIIENNPLIFKNGRYQMNFDDLREKAKDPLSKLIVLCSPHNPVGRVWTKDELIQLGEICIKNEILIISDEIHSDLILNGFRHTPFASISNDFLKHSITCTSPSKTFNLAGLQTSNVIISDPEKRNKFSQKLDSNGIHSPNVFGALALEAAYRHGEDWLNQLLDYLQNNLKYLKNFIREKIPKIKVIEPEATYLVWLDCRGLGLNRNELKKFMLGEAKVALDDGYIFGKSEGDGFERINIACPKATLKKGLKRIENAVQNL